MTDYEWYVLDVNPEPWAVGSLGVGRRGGQVYPYMGKNLQLDAYKKAIKEGILSQYGTQPLIAGFVDLRLFFWRNRAKYLNVAGRTNRKNDVDTTNMQKATEDALQGVLFGNDKFVINCKSSIVAQGPEVIGKVVIGVRSITPDDVIREYRELPESIRRKIADIDANAVPEESPNKWGNSEELF